MQKIRKEYFQKVEMIDNFLRLMKEICNYVIFIEEDVKSFDIRRKRI